MTVKPLSIHVTPRIKGPLSYAIIASKQAHELSSRETGEKVKDKHSGYSSYLCLYIWLLRPFCTLQGRSNFSHHARRRDSLAGNLQNWRRMWNHRASRKQPRRHNVVWGPHWGIAYLRSKSRSAKASFRFWSLNVTAHFSFGGTFFVASLVPYLWWCQDHIFPTYNEDALKARETRIDRTTMIKPVHHGLSLVNSTLFG